jgi:hypothetical protein
VLTGETGKPDKSGNSIKAAMRTRVAQAKAGDTITLSNSTPYAADLERGTSKKAPTGMVGTTMVEAQSIVSQAAQRLKK